jgi:hypothetical protein
MLRESAIQIGGSSVLQKQPGLSGELPSFSAARGLSVLRLEGNGLAGPLPGLPGSVQDVRLSQNRLSGSIPAEYGRLDRLHTLRLEQNDLSGAIPDGELPLMSSIV